MCALFLSGFLPIISFRFGLCPSARFACGRWRVDIEVWSLFSVRAVMSYSGEEIEGLTVKVFGGDFGLVPTNW